MNMPHKNEKIIFSGFIIWRCVLIISAFASFFVFDNFSKNFFGAGFDNYNFLPNLYGWANFDGEHYLSISTIGYKSLEQAFFPLYPGLISFVIYFLPKTLFWASLAGLLISNISFLGALYFLFRLLRLDYNEKFSFGVISLLLLFPTSFFFGAVYNESLFLLLAVASFFFARKKKWFYAALFGVLASSTRAIGVLIFPALIIEAYNQKSSLRHFWPIFFIPTGLFLYMFYLYLTTNDPLAFYNYQLIVGEQHQRGIILLPQILYRYLKIIFSQGLPFYSFQISILELFCGVLFLVLPIYGYFKKIRVSYLFFGLAGYLVPTVQGSFSSIPRYVIVLFPAFIALNFLTNKIPKNIRVLFFIISSIILVFETMLFIRGYWVA